MVSSRPVLTIERVWSRTWELVKTRWGTLIAVGVFQSLIGLGITTFSTIVSDALTPFFSGPLKILSLSPLSAMVPGITSYLVSLLIFPITSLASGFVSVGSTKVFLDILRGEPFRWSRLLQHRLLEWAYMVALANVIFYTTSIGFVLLLIPGLILTFGFAMSGLILIDKEVDPIQALADSWRMMQGQKMFLMLNYGLAGLAMAVGTLACLMGLIPAIMVTMLLTPVMYETMNSHDESLQSDPPSSPVVTELTPDPSAGIESDLDPDSDTDVELDPEPNQTS